MCRPTYLDDVSLWNGVVAVDGIWEAEIGKCHDEDGDEEYYKEQRYELPGVMYGQVHQCRLQKCDKSIAKLVVSFFTELNHGPTDFVDSAGHRLGGNGNEMVSLPLGSHTSVSQAEDSKSSSII